MKRVFLIVLDSFGIGAAPDAEAFGDAGSDTLGAIVSSENFYAPNLTRLGMFEIEGHICHNPENIVVFTGGDANYFVKRMKNCIFVVCNLVLMGLALMAAEKTENE